MTYDEKEQTEDEDSFIFMNTIMQNKTRNRHKQHKTMQEKFVNHKWKTRLRFRILSKRNLNGIFDVVNSHSNFILMDVNYTGDKMVPLVKYEKL